MLNILIADDHEIVREGLKQILLEEFVFLNILEAGDAHTVIKYCSTEKFDIIISDLSMPGGGGFAVLAEVSEKLPGLPVLILSIYPEDQYALRTLRAGASGYLNKDAAGEDLIKAVRHILSGKKFMSTAIAEKYYTDREKGERLPHEELSERERTVFGLLASGISIADIATILTVNVSTVSTYRSRILEKMNMQSNAEITKYAMEYKLI